MEGTILIGKTAKVYVEIVQEVGIAGVKQKDTQCNQKHARIFQKIREKNTVFFMLHQ